MYVVAAIIAAFLLPFFLLKKGVKRSTAWFASCFVVPALVLFTEFVLPSSGGGASMWPIAFVVGGFWSAVAGALGTFIAGKVGKGPERHDA